MNISRVEEPVTPTQVELSIRLAQQELVAAFGMFSIRSADLDGILDQACQIAARGLNMRFAKVLKFRTETKDFLLTHGVGWHAGIVGNAVLGADLASPAGYAFQTKMPVVSNHLSTEARFRTPQLLVEHGIHRAINVIIGDESSAPFGVLEADSTERLQFTKHDVAFMQSLANVLAAALDRQKQQATQAALLREKDLLMQEVHHRIKNSLQLVQTMLYLQARAVEDEGESSRLNEAAARIASIAAVHRQLHEVGAIDRVDLPSYLEGLLAEIAGSLTSPDTQRPITVDAAPLRLPAEHVTPIGLIAVELATNALKYGDGAISMRVRESPAGVCIEVEDQGAGFPEGFNPASSRSLGMRLIAALARSPGAISVSRSGDKTLVTVQVTFPELAARG